MDSIWENTVEIPKYPSLNRDIKTDVLVVGGGIAGLLCAYKLKQKGYTCIVAEQDRICNGITQNTTAKITLQHGLIYNRLINEFGVEKAGMYLEANRRALDEYKNICKVIDCDFSLQDSYVYSIDNVKKIEKEIKAFGKIGYDAEFCDNLPLPFPIAGAVKIKEQAQFNPLKFLLELAKNLEIYEKTKVIEIRNKKAITQNNTISADKIIIATHFPFMNKHGSYFLKMYQQRCYVSAFEKCKPVKGLYIDESKNGFSFRDYKDYLIIGGSCARTGRQTEGWQKIRDFARQNYPGCIEKYSWATQDCITIDGVPYIGEYSLNTPDIYVATGFNKWGMTSSMNAAIMLSNLIENKKDEFSELFCPSRWMFRKQLALNGINSLMNLVTISKKRCPHLGCALKWNPHEHSWDCPCHGSRFTDKGEILDNPATGNLK